MIFSQYKETCEVLLDYTTKVEGGIKDYVKKEISNILHTHIAVHIRKLISEFPEDGVKYISKIQSYCASMNFSDKSRYDRISIKLRIKKGDQQLITSRYSKIHRLYQFQWETVILRIN